jgi:hypothetical protein
MDDLGHADKSTDSKGAKGPRKPRSTHTLLVAASVACIALVAVVLVVGQFSPRLADPGGITQCGDPPPVSDEDVKGKIEAEAKSLGSLLTSPGLSKEVTRKRTEIFSKYASGERALAYYQYQVCVLLMNDKTMPTTQKLLALEGIRKEEIKPRNGSARIYEYNVLNKKLDGGDVIVKSTFQRLDEYWIEIQNNVALFQFNQVLNDGDYVFLKDRDRNICLKIPINGNGAAGYMSTDDCKTWQEWNHFYVKQY